MVFAWTLPMAARSKYSIDEQPHDYVPDFIIRLKTDPAVRLNLEIGDEGLRPVGRRETCGAERWIAAVNADGTYGQWRYALVKRVTDVGDALARSFAAARLPSTVVYEPKMSVIPKVAETPSSFRK